LVDALDLGSSSSRSGGSSPPFRIYEPGGMLFRGGNMYPANLIIKIEYRKRSGPVTNRGPDGFIDSELTTAPATGKEDCESRDYGS
jgi:hypothetical protein